MKLLYRLILKQLYGIEVSTRLMAIRSSPDRGRQLRMAVMSLLVLVANVIFIGLLIGTPLILALLGIVQITENGQDGIYGYGFLALFLVTVLLLIGQYWYAVLRALRPSSVETESPQAQTVQAHLQRLATQAAIKPPSVAVLDSSVPNCYTVGRQENATIVVSTGLISALDENELDAVLAHELAHVLNHDVTVMTVAVAPFRMARWFSE